MTSPRERVSELHLTVVTECSPFFFARRPTQLIALRVQPILWWCRNGVGFETRVIFVGL